MQVWTPSKSIFILCKEGFLALFLALAIATTIHFLSTEDNSPVDSKRSAEVRIKEAKAEFERIKSERGGKIMPWELKKPEIVLPPLLVMVREELQEEEIDVPRLEAAIRNDPSQFVAEVPEIGRKRFLLLSPDDEKKLGERCEKEFAKDKIYEDAEERARLTRIAEKLQTVLPKGVPQKIILYRDDTINAFCLPNGTVCVHSGLMKTLPDDQVAFVLAHECAHYVARHANEKFTKTMFLIAGNMLVLQKQHKLTAEGKEFRGLLLQVGYLASGKLFCQLPYSREMENEADTLAARYVARAGLDPLGGVRFFENLLKHRKEPFWAQWLSTHPSDEKRLKRIRKECEEISKKNSEKQKQAKLVKR